MTRCASFTNELHTGIDIDGLTLTAHDMLSTVSFVLIYTQVTFVLLLPTVLVQCHTARTRRRITEPHQPLGSRDVTSSTSKLLSARLGSVSTNMARLSILPLFALLLAAILYLASPAQASKGPVITNKVGSLEQVPNWTDPLGLL